MDTRFGFMPEEGEMAARIRALDWQGTPLGEPQTWSATLRTSLSLCLSSRFPVLLWFGEDFRILYNDAYIPFLGPAKHPMALGQAGEQCWREIWPSIGPMLESVYRTRQATWTHDGQYFFDRALPREEVYVTFTYAPIFSADGSTVEGVFCPCTETTHQVINARRWETLRKLGMRSLETRNMAAACQHISQTLDENRLDVPFAAIYERSDDATFTLLASTGLSEPAHLASNNWPLAQASQTGQAIDVNLTAAGLSLPGGAWPEPADCARVVPVRWAADEAVSGVIVLGVSPRRPLDDEYTRFLDLVALHTSTSIANVLAYEQESRRAHALADLDRAKTDFFANVSHEFRTPLTLILGPVQAMLADPANPPAREQLAMVERNALRLQKLVNQLLDFSRLEADRHAANFVATPLDTLTRELTAVFESAIEKAGLRLSVSCDPLGARSGLTATALGAEHFLEASLRWAPDETAASPRPTDASVAAPRARILWADDNADMRTYVARLLAPAYEVETVPDGQAALASAQQDPPALVLTDIMMPGLDGFALLRALREDARTRDVPVILISARAGEQARVDGMRAGADDYLVKPFSARELIACVDGHVRLAAARAEARHALSASEQRLRTVIDQLPTGVGVTDLQGRWLMANGLMERYVPKGVPSRTPERIARWQAWDADGNALAPSEWPSARALRGESVVPGLDARYLDDEGVEHWLRVSAAPWRDDDGTVMGACTVVQDVTQLKHAQQRLQDADRRKNEFLATLAHELRNPLAPISNGLFLLRQEGLEPAAADNVRDMLERQVRHLVRLVDDLMEISRIAGGKITLRKQSVDVDSLLRNAIETSRPLIDANAHRLTVSLPDEPLYLRADPVRLTQVFANLLNNAAKYTDPGGSIDVSARRERGQVVVRVRDNGVGITAEMLPRLFDLFTQVDPLNERAQGGLGIGLTLVRNLVERHQGSVQAYSDGPGSGSEFVVRLPLDRAPAQPAATPAPVPDAARRLGKIMVVDDHPDVGDSMAAILSALGAQVRVCRSGPDALAALQGFHPRVMLLDIGMPGMDGYELAQRVRAQPHLQDITLVVLSGWGQQADMARSRAVGIEHHLVKPVDPVELERLLARICTQEAPNAPGQAASAKGQPSHDTPAG